MLFSILSCIRIFELILFPDKKKDQNEAPRSPARWGPLCGSPPRPQHGLLWPWGSCQALVGRWMEGALGSR